MNAYAAKLLSRSAPAGQTCATASERTISASDAPLQIPTQARSATVNDGRPLVSVEAAAFIIGRDNEFIEDKVNSGELVSWNIAQPGARARLLRLWSISVYAFKSGLNFRVSPTLKSLASAVLPASRQIWPVSKAAWTLHCTREHTRQRGLRKIQTAAADAGVRINHPVRNPDRVMRGIELEQAARARIEAKERAASQEDISSPGLQTQSTPGASGPKTYILKTAPATFTTVKIYFSLWAQVKKIKPGFTEKTRHALTQKAIGCHPKPQEMTAEQLTKMISVFSAIIRDSQKQTT